VTSVYLVTVNFRTCFRMNFTDRVKAKFASCLLFFIWQKSRTLGFYCEYPWKK